MNYTVIRSAISSLPSVGIIRLLQEQQIKVIGTDLLSSSAAATLLDKVFVVPKATPENEDLLITQYSDLIKKHKVSTLLSGPENEINVLAKHETVFTQLGCNIFHPPFASLQIITDKYALYNTLKTKLACSNFHLASEFDTSHCGKHEWILKPRQGRGSAGISLLNQYNLSQHKSQLTDAYIVQERLQGQEFTVDFLCDFNGQLLNCVPRKREVVDSGIAVVASTVKNTELINNVKTLCATIPVRGFNCVQFIEHKGQYVLTDFNPRIGGGSILSLQASASLTQNFINLLKSKPVKANLQDTAYRELSMFRYYAEIYQ